MCVAEVRTRVFNAFVSSAFSSAYSVRHQHKMRSLLAINMFVCCVILYLEVTSRDLLVASKEHACLQYDIVFVGEYQRLSHC